MSLRSKIALIVALVVLAYSLFDLWMQRSMVLPRFAALERDEAREDVLRVRQAMLAEIDALDARCSEWATWSETCAFLENARRSGDPTAAARASRFETSNLGLESFRRSRIDLLYVVDRDGTVRWGRVRDRDSGAELALAELSYERLILRHPLLRRPGTPETSPSEPIRGLSLTELGPMFLSSRPIECGGEWNGTLILGRVLAPAVSAELATRTEVLFRMFRLDRELPPEEQALFDQVSASATPVIQDRGNHAPLAAYTTINDLLQRPALLVRADVDRTILARGSEAARYALVSTLAAGFLLLFVLLTVLRRAVIDPLTALTSHAVEIGRTDDWSRKLASTRPDEIGVLSRELDRMMDKLERSRAQLVDSARTAGMSEIATGILHNVGNVLNSVNVSADLVAQRLQGSKITKLERLLELVESQGESVAQFISTDPRGQHVVPFLGEVTRTLRTDHDEIEREIRSLEDGIEHIRKLVDAQQQLAGKSELREPTELGPQIELAWSLVHDAGGAAGAPELVREIADLGRVRLDRHKLVQVLVNLFKNACEAIAEAGQRPGRVRVRASRKGEDRLAIEVSDDGVGILEANLTRIFQHGFTTKPGGHGFGLHSCANAATEMGGTIRAESEGPGRGATFVLELPLEVLAAT